MTTKTPTPPEVSDLLMARATGGDPQRRGLPAVGVLPGS